MSQHSPTAADNKPAALARNPTSISVRVILAAIAGLLIGLLVGYAAGDLPIAKQPNPLSMDQCVNDTLRLFEQSHPPTPDILRDAREHCYSLIQAQEMLSDFAIRKLNFFQQYRANGVLMAMVVAVTLSGVLLAGVQLRISHQLAAVNRASLEPHGSELILQRDRLVLKSSVTGLFILSISFCFFLVFVLYVYRLESPAQNNAVAPSIVTLPPGGLGPPPDKSK